MVIRYDWDMKGFNPATIPGGMRIIQTCQDLLFTKERIMERKYLFFDKLFNIIIVELIIKS